MKAKRGSVKGPKGVPSGRIFWALSVASLLAVLTLRLNMPTAAMRESKSRGMMLEEKAKPLAKQLSDSPVVSGKMGGGSLPNEWKNDHRKITLLQEARRLGGWTNESLGGEMDLEGFGKLNLTGMPAFLQEIYRGVVQPQAEVSHIRFSGP